MGNNVFCIKACDPAGKNAASLCQHTYDRMGCAYNAPNAARNGTFESCEGEDQDPPGVYTSSGKVVTYTQPPESLGPIRSVPYKARVPASSNCATFQSARLFAALTSGASVSSATPSAAASTASAASGATNNIVPSSSGSKTPSPTAKSSAVSLMASGWVSLVAVTFAVLFSG
jgi:hypothetical protein